MAKKQNFVVVVCKKDQVADAKDYWVKHAKHELVCEHGESERMRVFIDTPTNLPAPVFDGYDRYVLVFASKKPPEASPP